jgi:hypothetical protein
MWLGRFSSFPGSEEYCLPNRQRQFHLVEHPGRIQEILAGFVDYPQQAPRFCFRIGEQSVQLSPLESRLIARVLEEKDQIPCFCSHDRTRCRAGGARTESFLVKEVRKR